MSDLIRAMTAELAAEPGSLVFLDLAELLRRRGQFDAALKVAASGAARYPTLADAHDLRARIHSDRGDSEAAFDAWMDALQLDPSHVGAHKGLGFLYFRAGDAARALRHLETALTRSDDPGLQAALMRVRAAVAEAEAEAPAPAVASADEPAEYQRVPAAGGDLPFSLADTPGSATPSDQDLFAGFEGARDGLLLLDAQGMRLGGGLRDPDGADVADAVAAHLAGVSREAARTARLLELGSWSSVSAECADGNLHLCAPTPDAVLLTVRDTSIPAGRLGLLADRASAAARRWLGGSA